MVLITMQECVSGVRLGAWHPWTLTCGLRVLLQVLEETGYDIEELVREEDFIELTLDGKRNKLYIVAGLDPNSAQFAPKCKGVSCAALP